MNHNPTAAEKADAKADAKADKGKDTYPDTYEVAVGRIASAIKVFTDAGVGGQAAADLAVRVFEKC